MTTAVAPAKINLSVQNQNRARKNLALFVLRLLILMNLTRAMYFCPQRASQNQPRAHLLQPDTVQNQDAITPKSLHQQVRPGS
jgi:hypothetical protein